MEDRLLKLYMFLPVVALVLGIIYVFTAEDSYRYECQDPANWEQAYCHPPLCEAVAACTKDLIYNGEEVVSQIMESGVQLIPLDMTPAEETVVEPTAPADVPIEDILNQVATEEQAP